MQFHLLDVVEKPLLEDERLQAVQGLVYTRMQPDQPETNVWETEEF